ncbi:hypothetical protein GEMRC1_001479 [Eukaryota sp. GEM-RC1]
MSILLENLSLLPCAPSQETSSLLRQCCLFFASSHYLDQARGRAGRVAVYCCQIEVCQFLLTSGISDCSSDVICLNQLLNLARQNQSNTIKAVAIIRLSKVIDHFVESYYDDQLSELVSTLSDFVFDLLPQLFSKDCELQYQCALCILSITRVLSPTTAKHVLIDLLVSLPEMRELQKKEILGLRAVYALEKVCSSGEYFVDAVLTAMIADCSVSNVDDHSEYNQITLPITFADYLIRYLVKNESIQASAIEIIHRHVSKAIKRPFVPQHVIKLAIFVFGEFCHLYSNTIDLVRFFTSILPLNSGGVRFYLKSWSHHFVPLIVTALTKIAVYDVVESTNFKIVGKSQPQDSLGELSVLSSEFLSKEQIEEQQMSMVDFDVGKVKAKGLRDHEIKKIVKSLFFKILENIGVESGVSVEIETRILEGLQLIELSPAMCDEVFQILPKFEDEPMEDMFPWNYRGAVLDLLQQQLAVEEERQSLSQEEEGQQDSEVEETPSERNGSDLFSFGDDSQVSVSFVDMIAPTMSRSPSDREFDLTGVETTHEELTSSSPKPITEQLPEQSVPVNVEESGAMEDQIEGKDESQDTIEVQEGDFNEDSLVVEEEEFVSELDLFAQSFSPKMEGGDADDFSENEFRQFSFEMKSVPESFTSAIDFIASVADEDEQ